MSALFSSVLDSIDAGVIVLDLERRILFLNRQFARTVGIHAEEWVGRSAAELEPVVAPRLVAPEVFTESSQVEGLEPKARRSVDFEWRTQDGVLDARSDDSPLYDQNGTVVGRVFLYRDISREKNIDRMKSEFIAVASHELRTPMTSIKGSVDLILSGFAGPISADTHELLEIAKKNCDRLIRMINEILDLAKIEAGQIKLDLVKADLAESVERSLRGVKSLADGSGVRLSLVRRTPLPSVEIDRDRIDQVITNLLSNAIKFSPVNGEVSVELSAADGLVRCAVVDQGTGISEEDLPKVFGKFEQVGEQRKGGTGLGLAITQAFVHEHRGKIWAESELGKGSRFCFALRASGGLQTADPVPPSPEGQEAAPPAVED